MKRILRIGEVLAITVSLLPVILSGQDNFLPGRITPRVTCLNDTAQHYAAYVPPGYTDSLDWPAIIFFEPAARAMLPLERYATLASEFGYFMFCSYNSRNGPNEPIFEAANALYADAFERFSLDRGQVCLAGFSGGARISCLIALSNPEIHCVIGCGAGFPHSERPDGNITFNYCGIIGKQDMNYQEMLMLDSVLDRRQARSILFTFPGGHRWPDTNTIRSGFYWLTTQSMRTGARPPDKALLEQIRREYSLRADTLRRHDDPLALARTLKNATLLLEGLADVEAFRTELEQLLISEDYAEALHDHYALAATESGLHGRYWSEFEHISLRALDPDHPVRSPSWWKKEFRKIDDLEDPDLRARLHEFVVNGSWEQHIGALRADRYPVALTFLEVYGAGLPQDPSPDFYRARVHALAGDPAAMYHCLKMAIDKGFSAPERILQDEAFREYLGQGTMQRLLEDLKLKNEN